MNIIHGMYNIKTLKECNILLNNQTFHDSREFITKYWQPTNAAIHLPANSTLLFAVNQRKPILIH